MTAADAASRSYRSSLDIKKSAYRATTLPFPLSLSSAHSPPSLLLLLCFFFPSSPPLFPFLFSLPFFLSSFLSFFRSHPLRRGNRVTDTNTNAVGRGERRGYEGGRRRGGWFDSGRFSPRSFSSCEKTMARYFAISCHRLSLPIRNC